MEAIDSEQAKKDKAQSDKDHYESKQIIVRIWTSAFNPRIKGKDVGHVSIEIDKDHYLSLWPREGLPGGLELIKGVPHKFLSSYAADCAKDAENRSAECTLCFYTLEKNYMLAEFERLKAETKEWAIVEGLPWTLFAESCVSSAWRILLAGGIKDLVSDSRQREIRREGSQVGSHRSTVGTLFLPIHASSSEGDGVREDIQDIGYGAFAIEMGLGNRFKSPDYMAEVLIEAKKGDVLKLWEKGVPPIVFDGETLISDLPGEWSERKGCMIL